MESKKLLIVEDDVTSQVMLKAMLKDHQLTVVESGEAGIEAARDCPDLIILDINLPGIDGYETCRCLREMAETRSTPIIFLSSYTALEDRLQAYGVGGNDYISKPFDAAELMTKISLHCKAVDRKKALDQDLKASHELLMEVQTSASKIQAISRFIQATLFCHDIDGLFRHFFKTARDIGLDCVLSISSADGVEMRSVNGSVSRLEKEILDMAANVSRIHRFGQDRAIFRWSRGVLLTSKVGEMIDTLALFMDALEAGIKSVDGENKLLRQVEQLEMESTYVRDRVSDLFKLMNNDLKHAILSLGIVSALDEDEEDRLASLVDDFSTRIDAELETLSENNNSMQLLIKELRTPPPELQGLMDESSDDAGDDGGDGVMLF